MKTFYFNTGVRRFRHSSPIPLMNGQIWSADGVKLIPFDCADVPDGATFKYACDNPDLESNDPRVIVREIANPYPVGGMMSKYAYFTI